MQFNDLKILIEEIQSSLSDGIAIVRTIHELENNRWIIVMRLPGRNVSLEFCLNHPFAYLIEINDKNENAHPPSTFTMLLRKWLTGTECRSLELATDDRIVTLLFVARDGSDRVYRLQIELLSKFPGAFLIDEEGIVLGGTPASMWRQEGEESETRYRLTAGKPYVLPASSFHLDEKASWLTQIPKGRRNITYAEKNTRGDC